VRVVVARTGLTPDLLRVWERRYRAVAPTRSAGRQRLYTDLDVERLALLALLTNAGRRIHGIARCAIDELRALARDVRPAGASGDRQPIRPASTLARALDAVSRLDAPALEEILRHAAQRLGPDDMIDSLVVPLLREIGERWHRGELSVANEHLASDVVRSTLAWLKERSAPPPGAPTILVATPAGQHHEIGALIIAATAAARGWHVVYLGPNLPGEALLSAIERTRCRAVALSLIYPADDPRLRAALARLTRLMPRRVGLLLGGAAAHRYVASAGPRATALRGLADFREWLEAERRPATSRN
jgi:methanogenic corrinoid protein MtbC1